MKCDMFVAYDLETDCIENQSCRLRSVSMNLAENTVNQCFENGSDTYTFSAKEKDSESGLYYYGARYYDPDLGIWLSVDPMTSKYPSFSPYVFCGDNPVKFVDLEGEEIGDYYDFYGNYLGWDGNKDNKIHFVQGSSTTYISTNHKQKKTTRVDDPNIKISHTSTYGDINKAVEIFDMAKKNEGGTSEEGGAFDDNGLWHQGEGYSDHVKLPIASGQTSIHSHTWGKADETSSDYRSPTNPSSKDLESFKGFGQNIIVGKLVGEYNSFAGHDTVSKSVSERREFRFISPGNKGSSCHLGRTYEQGRTLTFRILHDRYGNFHSAILAVFRNQEDECNWLAGMPL